MDKEDEEFLRRLKKFFKYFILITGTFFLTSLLICYLRYRNQRNVEDSFSLINPKISFSTSYFYDIERIFGRKIYGREKVKQIGNNINRLTEKDTSKIDELLSLIRFTDINKYYIYDIYDNLTVSLPAVKALSRMARKNKKARNAICYIIQKPWIPNYETISEFAARELRLIDPRRAFYEVTVSLGRNFDIFTKDNKGTEEELKYLIKNNYYNNRLYLADFVINNHQKEYIMNYRNEIVSKLSHISVCDYGASYKYAKAIWCVARDYAENELSKKIENLYCLDCWVHGKLNYNKGYILRGAHGR